ncbi:MAG TPA: endo alpha-1,4 polygalactosaminidase [Micromonosporaceae bacterium]|nr:endo alpha-1,4 polygalactosaminidase [Micromonosporaceae bacterium]
MSRRRTRWVAAAVLVAGLILGYAVACTDWTARRGAPRGSPGTSPSAGSASQPGSAAPSPTALPSGSESAVPSSGAPTVGPGSSPPGGWWRPKPGLSWQWQLSGPLDRSVPADVYDIDGVESSAADVAALHAAGRRVICYLNAGAYEDFRPDRGRFPAAVLGRELDGWPGERWLDVRRWDVLAPIMTARMRQCRDKGFDAVEPDNVDAYANDSGFPLTAADQLTYNRRLADLAHSLGLAVGLKNNVEQAAELAPVFDFAVNEECASYDECDALRVFPESGKPVFHTEYDVPTVTFCAAARARGFSSIRKRLDLDAWRETC